MSERMTDEEFDRRFGDDLAPLDPVVGGPDVVWQVLRHEARRARAEEVRLRKELLVAQLPGECCAALRAQLVQAREALLAAARSLETVSNQRDTDDIWELRAYALNRSKVARAALGGERQG